jgi:hypothetical protein
MSETNTISPLRQRMIEDMAAHNATIVEAQNAKARLFLVAASGSFRRQPLAWACVSVSHWGGQPNATADHRVIAGRPIRPHLRHFCRST